MAQTYLIRKPDDKLWRKFKAAAAKDGVTMRTVILRLIAGYVERAERRAA